MSNCLVLQGKNFIAIGADTASSILIDKKYRRIGVDAKKLYRFGDEIMFCSGKMELVELVTSNVVAKGNKIDLDDLTEFIKSLNIEKSDTYDIEILICGVENNKSYMHQISQYNDFEVKTITNNTNGCAIYSTGFNSKTMLDTAKNNYPLCQNVSDLFIKSFKDISSEEVGGCINMYLLQENQTTKCVDNYKVDDIETISVSRNDIHYVVADVLIGDLIFGKTLHINNGKDTLIMDENGLTITNGVNTIIFDPNNTELMRVTNLDKKIFYFNELGDLFIDGNIFGGSLHLENEIGTYVDIDPGKENIMEIGSCVDNGMQIEYYDGQVFPKDKTHLYDVSFDTEYEEITSSKKSPFKRKGYKYYTRSISNNRNYYDYETDLWYWLDYSYYIVSYNIDDNGTVGSKINTIKTFSLPSNCYFFCLVNKYAIFYPKDNTGNYIKSYNILTGEEKQIDILANSNTYIKYVGDTKNNILYCFVRPLTDDDENIVYQINVADGTFNKYTSAYDFTKINCNFFYDYFVVINQDFIIQQDNNKDDIGVTEVKIEFINVNGFNIEKKIEFIINDAVNMYITRLFVETSSDEETLFLEYKALMNNITCSDDNRCHCAKVTMKDGEINLEGFN